jgi:hypothetical protein
VSAVRSPITTAAAIPAGVGERFAARAGVRLVDPDGAGDRPGGCRAVARLIDPDDPDGVVGAAHPVPPAAVTVLVDAAARAAAISALTEPDGTGEPPVLVLAAAGVQFHGAACGPLTAVATVPCERRLADRADAEGGLRFSVAVEVRDRGGAAVAAGSVQWVARIRTA